MLQYFPETVWSFWQLVGMVFAFLVVILWVFSSKWELDESDPPEVFPLPLLRRVIAIIAVPSLAGETLAVVASSIYYPEWLELILYRGIRYYLITLGSFAIIYFIGIQYNKRKRNTREVHENLS